MAQQEPSNSRRGRQERSAGVVLFREAPGSAPRLYLLLDYGRYWDFPKGHVEKGEDDRMAALRELEEETGITQAQLLPGFEHEIVYFFRHPKRGLIRKTVMFFLASTTQEAVRLSDEHVGAAWVPEPEAVGKVKYATAKQVLRAAIEFLARPGRISSGQ